MSASTYGQDLAASKGVRIVTGGGGVLEGVLASRRRLGERGGHVLAIDGGRVRDRCNEKGLHWDGVQAHGDDGAGYGRSASGDVVPYGDGHGDGSGGRCRQIVAPICQCSFGAEGQIVDPRCQRCNLTPFGAFLLDQADQCGFGRLQIIIGLGDLFLDQLDGKLLAHLGLGAAVCTDHQGFEC